jgi:hypothetical protein
MTAEIRAPHHVPVTLVLGKEPKVPNGWVDPGDGMGAGVKRKIPALARNQTMVVKLVASHFTVILSTNRYK